MDNKQVVRHIARLAYLATILLLLLAMASRAEPVLADENGNEDDLSVLDAGDIDDDDDDGPFVPRQVVVKIDPASGATIEQINASYGTTTIRALLGSAGIYLLATPQGIPVEDLVGVMEQDPRLEYAEPNFLSETPEGDPSDTWAWGGRDGSRFSSQYGPRMLGLAEAHTITRGAGAVVAVLDTGVQLDHPVLAPHLTAVRYDFIDDDPVPEDEYNRRDDDRDGLIDEGAGHGTHVAGIVHLVAPEARIMPLRVLDDEGNGNVFIIAEAILFAAGEGATVINLSLGTSGESDLLEETIEDIIEDDAIVVVAAAGNLNSDEGQYPATIENVLAVTAIGPDGAKAPFANYGDWVTVATPGVSVFSTFLRGGYVWWSGTSMATPWVAGQAALIRSIEPALEPEGVEARIRGTAHPLDRWNPDYRGMLGAGLPDVPASLAPLVGSGCPQEDLTHEGTC